MTISTLSRLVASALLSAATVTASSSARQAPTFAAGTAVVSIDVLVTRDGKPVTDLKVEDFQVRDGGAVQAVQLNALEAVPVALVLALDTSASVRGPAFDRLKESAKAAVSSLRAADQAALITFSQHISLASGWTDDKRRLHAAIDAATAQGSTSLTDAAFAALCQRPPRSARNLTLVFTDGDDSSSWLGTDAVLAAAHRSESVVYGITLSVAPAGGARADDRRLLPLLAQETGGESFSASDIRDLRAAFLDVLARFNQRYLLTYAPPHALGSGWHPVEVRVNDPALKVTARRGYTR